MEDLGVLIPRKAGTVLPLTIPRQLNDVSNRL